MKHLICLLLLGTLTMPLLAQELPDDFLPPEFHQSRREALRQQLPPNSVAVFFANPVRNRANDVDYVYHQDPDFYYLTGYREPHSMLILFSESQRREDGSSYDELLFAQARNPQMEMWTGRRLGPEGVVEKLGIAEVQDHRDFKETNLDFKAFDKVFFFGFHNDVRDTRNEADLYDLISTFREKAGIPSNFNPYRQQLIAAMREIDSDNYEMMAERIYAASQRNPELREDPLFEAYAKAGSARAAKKVLKKVPETNLDGYTLGNMMGKLRMIKSPEELRLLRKAVEISCVGQVEVMKAMHPGMSESEIQGIHEFVFKKYGAEYEGYPSIVGGGHNGCILHYIDNNKPKVGTDLVLMDLGAEYHGYTADVTRTIPADGTFSEEQRIIYKIVLEAQNAGFEACRPGADFRAPHLAAREVIDRRLAEIGLIEPGASHNYFPHGTSHYLGLDVHDRGTGEPLAPGVVITVEPGIYIPENSPCEKRWWGIAVRIEDDILITEDGYENLSAMAPRTVEAIETMMARPSPLSDFLLPGLNDEK